MKIAFVYDAVYPYRIGGVEKRIFEVARRLARRGHEVHIFGLMEWEGDTSFIKEGVYHHGLGKSRRFYIRGRRSISEALYFGWKVLTPLLKEHFDIIDCQNFPYFSCFSAAFGAKIRRSILVITWHEVWGDYWYVYLGRFGLPGKVIELLTSRLSDNLVAVSDLTKKDLISIRKSADITLIPNGIDFERINTIQPAELTSDIIFTGRLLKEKNVGLLIRALVLVREEIPEISCVIIGDGPEMDSLQGLVKELKLEDNIKFWGFVQNHDELIAAMKSSHIFATPSTREGFGISALEAMACGLPVVTVDAPKNALKDLVTEKTGRVSSLTPEAFAVAVLGCLHRRDAMTGHCKELAEDYNWEMVVEKTEKFYLGIIEVESSRGKNSHNL